MHEADVKNDYPRMAKEGNAGVIALREEVSADAIRAKVDEVLLLPTMLKLLLDVVEHVVIERRQIVDGEEGAIGGIFISSELKGDRERLSIGLQSEVVGCLIVELILDREPHGYALEREAGKDGFVDLRVNPLMDDVGDLLKRWFVGKLMLHEGSSARLRVGLEIPTYAPKMTDGVGTLDERSAGRACNSVHIA